MAGSGFFLGTMSPANTFITFATSSPSITFTMCGLRLSGPAEAEPGAPQRGCTAGRGSTGGLDGRAGGYLSGPDTGGGAGAGGEFQVPVGAGEREPGRASRSRAAAEAEAEEAEDAEGPRSAAAGAGQPTARVAGGGQVKKNFDLF